MKTLTYIICLTAILAVSAGMANAALVAQWKFDEGAGTVAQDSAGSNNGTLVNGAGWTTGVPTGAPNGAVHLDGVNDYVNVPDSPSLRFSQTSSFTITFWANQTSGGEVLSKMRASGQSGVFGYEIRCLTGGYADFHVECSGYAATDVTTGANSLAVGQWYHVATVYDNKSMKIYLNGELKGTTTFAYNTGSTTPDGPLVIGEREYDNYLEPYYYFGGSLDDLRFYNEALSGDSISHIYQTTPEPATLLLLGLGGLLIRKKGHKK